MAWPQIRQQAAVLMPGHSGAKDSCRQAPKTGGRCWISETTKIAPQEDGEDEATGLGWRTAPVRRRIPLAPGWQFRTGEAGMIRELFTELMYLLVFCLAKACCKTPCFKFGRPTAGKF